MKQQTLTTLLPQKIEQEAFCGDRGATFAVSSTVSSRAGMQATYGRFSSPVVALDLQATELDSEKEVDEEDTEDEDKHCHCMSKYAIV